MLSFEGKEIECLAKKLQLLRAYLGFGLSELCKSGQVIKCCCTQVPHFLNWESTSSYLRDVKQLNEVMYVKCLAQKVDTLMLFVTLMIITTSAFIIKSP